MARKACWMGLLMVALANTGCCRWCERWCGHSHAAPTYAAPAYAPAPVAYAPQQCVPCCPVPVCPPGSPVPSGQWQRQPFCP